MTIDVASIDAVLDGMLGHDHCGALGPVDREILVVDRLQRIIDEGRAASDLREELDEAQKCAARAEELEGSVDDLERDLKKERRATAEAADALDDLTNACRAWFASDRGEAAAAEFLDEFERISR